AGSLFELKALHRDGSGRAPGRAQAAADAFRFVVEKSAAVLRFSHHALDSLLIRDFTGGREMQAMLRADVDASIAQDAFRAVVDRMDMAVEASLRLFTRITRRKRGFDFRDSGAAREWNQRY